MVQTDNPDISSVSNTSSTSNTSNTSGAPNNDNLLDRAETTKLFTAVGFDRHYLQNILTDYQDALALMTDDELVLLSGMVAVKIHRQIRVSRLIREAFIEMQPKSGEELGSIDAVKHVLLEDLHRIFKDTNGDTKQSLDVFSGYIEEYLRIHGIDGLRTLAITMKEPLADVERIRAVLLKLPVIPDLDKNVCLEIVHQALRHSDERVQAAAGTAIAFYGSAQSVTPLIMALQSTLSPAMEEALTKILEHITNRSLHSSQKEDISNAISS